MRSCQSIPLFLKICVTIQPPFLFPQQKGEMGAHYVTMVFLHWEVLIMLLSQFPLNFHQIHNGRPCFIAYLMIIFALIEMVFVIIWKMFDGSLGEVVVSAAASELYEWVRVGTDVYIRHRKYQVKPILWQQLKLTSELETDIRDSADWGKKWYVDFNAVDFVRPV